jgi:hypothetical protein
MAGGAVMTTSPEQRRPAGRDRTPAEPEDTMTTTAPLPPRDLPRWVRWTVVPLLVLVPLGYVIISAQQSRVSGAGKQQKAALREMVWAVPSQAQRRIYQVPIPDGTTGDGFLETNSWTTSHFYAQFTTTAGGLDTFLAQIGTSRAALADGQVAIKGTDAERAGWDFTKRLPWAGVVVHRAGDKPDHDITVSFRHPDRPTVYVVSTVNFQHSFGGG